MANSRRNLTSVLFFLSAASTDRCNSHAFCTETSKAKQNNAHHHFFMRILVRIFCYVLVHSICSTNEHRPIVGYCAIMCGWLMFTCFWLTADHRFTLPSG